jgi:putative DNA methylase
MIERDFDVSFIADLALREKQIQQNYRPVIAVHKWFARRPGTLFRGLLLAEFAVKPLRETFYAGNRLSGLRVADPFMGGGTPLLEANRLGCDVIGFDINQMSYWIVQQELEHLDLDAYDRASKTLRTSLEQEIGQLYRTRCAICGSDDAQVKYFLWVKVQECDCCQRNIDLFPGYLLATNSRHPKNVFVCPVCGELTEFDDRRKPGRCYHCGAQLIPEGPAKRNRCRCPHCNAINAFPKPNAGPPRHRLFAIEYHCTKCGEAHIGRFFKKPDSSDLAKVEEAELKWQQAYAQFVPEDKIPGGDETDRLHRWGYRYYREMFNSRQLISLELSAQLISRVEHERVRRALATNLSDLLRYQNMLCRYDTMALKSLDIFSVHGFPVGLIQCESNFLGIMDPGRSVCIGSGGWANIIEKFRKAKAYCDQPFEVRYRGQRKEVIKIFGEWIGDCLNGSSDGECRNIEIQCADAATINVRECSLDAVFTDPPYFGNVQYAELMDFCYVWLRRLAVAPPGIFDSPSTRNAAELTGNDNMRRGLGHFTEGLSAVFRRMAKALKPGSPLAFTYHHNSIKAYIPVAVAILDSGLTCSASLPCPAEMGASIHIYGTGSSIIDTVFICRSTGTIPRKWLVSTPSEVAKLVDADLEKLREGNVRPTAGDKRCIAFGHLIRLAVWSLKKNWNRDDKTGARINKVESWLEQFGGWSEVEKYLNQAEPVSVTDSQLALCENASEYGGMDAEVSF